MNEHAEFNNTEVVVHDGEALVPVFVQDTDDYPGDTFPVPVAPVDSEGFYGEESSVLEAEDFFDDED